MNSLFSNVLRRSILRRAGPKQPRQYSTQPSKPNTTGSTNSTTSTTTSTSSAKLSAKQIRRELLRGNKVTKIAGVASVLTFAGATGYYLYGIVFSGDIIRIYFLIFIIELISNLNATLY